MKRESPVVPWQFLTLTFFGMFCCSLRDTLGLKVSYAKGSGLWHCVCGGFVSARMYL